MTTRVAWLSALTGLAVAPLFAQTGTDAQLERAAERRFRSAEQFYAGGRYAQALRDFEAILETMPGSRLADDAALRIARHRFEVEADPAAAEAMVDRLVRAYPAGDTVPGAHLLLGRIAMASLPPRPRDALAEYERVLTAAGPGGSPWSFAALTGIARISSDFMEDRAAAGALLAALHEIRSAPASAGDRFGARLLLASTLARLGETDAALGETARLRADLLRILRDGPDESSRESGDPETFSAARLAEEARELATLVARYRAPGAPAWRFAGAIQPPQRLDRPLRVRIAAGRLHILDRDTDELQTFSLAGDFDGALGIDDSWDLAFAPATAPGGGTSAVPVVAAEDALIVAGNAQTLRGPNGSERLRRIRAVAVTPEGYWVWDDREKAIFRFARSGQFLGAVPHPRLDEVHRIARHPAGHLVVVEDRQGVLAFDAEGRRIFHLTRESGFRRPVDVAFDGLGNLFVLDREGPTLGVFDREFTPLITVRGREWTDGAARRPVSLDVGPDGRLYVLDESTRTVVVLR